MVKKTHPYHQLESILGYQFKNLELLKESLTHRSFANEKSRSRITHNERLEFLGDAVLELAISDLIMKRFPDYAEGGLSRLRAAIVNETQLADLATHLDLGSMVFLGKGEEQTRGRNKSSILANTYEAILAAVYLDGGYQTAFKVVRSHFSKLIESAALSSIDRDYKTQLQVEVQKRYKRMPVYSTIKEVGPDHFKQFEVKVMIRSDAFTHGSGNSKKEAEQAAAKLALQLLKEEESF